jgi:hypothetical protein
MPETDFDYVNFDHEVFMELGYQLPQLEVNLNEEGKLIVGEFLYSCYWTFTTLRPEWVPDDPRLQQEIKTSYLIPSAMQFYFPEAMNSLAYKLLENDIYIIDDVIEIPKIQLYN